MSFLKNSWSLLVLAVLLMIVQVSFAQSINNKTITYQGFTMRVPSTAAIFDPTQPELSLVISEGLTLHFKKLPSIESAEKAATVYGAGMEMGIRPNATPLQMIAQGTTVYYVKGEDSERNDCLIAAAGTSGEFIGILVEYADGRSLMDAKMILQSIRKSTSIAKL